MRKTASPKPRFKKPIHETADAAPSATPKKSIPMIAEGKPVPTAPVKEKADTVKKALEVAPPAPADTVVIAIGKAGKGKRNTVAEEVSEPLAKPVKAKAAKAPVPPPVVEKAAVAPPKSPPSQKAKPERPVDRPLLVSTAKPKLATKRGMPKRSARDLRITVFVARGGPMRGDADYELAFPNRNQALAFLSNQHGLTIDEQRQLARASRLKLNRRWHGSEACALREVALDPDQAARVLQGESAAA